MNKFLVHCDDEMLCVFFMKWLGNFQFSLLLLLTRDNARVEASMCPMDALQMTAGVVSIPRIVTWASTKRQKPPWQITLRHATKTTSKITQTQTASMCLGYDNWKPQKWIHFLPLWLDRRASLLCGGVRRANLISFYILQPFQFGDNASILIICFNLMFNGFQHKTGVYARCWQFFSWDMHVPYYIPSTRGERRVKPRRRKLKKHIKLNC